MTDRLRIVQIAVPVPVRRLFDYLIPPNQPLPPLGVRVRVPFGRRRTIVGIVAGATAESEVPVRRLKPITRILDAEPLFASSLLGLLQWAADYYQYPVGEVFAAALPVRLRTRDATEESGRIRFWTLTGEGVGIKPQALKRKLVQQRIVEALRVAPAGLEERALAALSARWRVAAEALIEKGWVSFQEREDLPADPTESASGPELTQAQATAVQVILAARGFSTFLLYGVTGSGKTEVYLRAMAEVLARGDQVLVLVPEIGLTPQFVTRLQQRFAIPLAVLHSGLSDQERASAWLMARAGSARIVVGTRSAVFTPLPRLGLVVVDEEHDPSYKQQDGFRYSARDVAIMRASREGVPIVLGSATPSLETLKRAREGSYTALVLPARVGGAELPAIELLDMRRLPADDGLSHPLRAAIAQTLEKGEQALLFLNRRGFAPVWMCVACGWVAPCRRCDARLTLHRGSGRLRCHYCGADQALVTACPTCGVDGLHALGEGTQRVESALERFFPKARVIRIDRDSTRSKGSLQEKLEQVHRREVDILIGTQMLSKGHDFPDVTLVGVLNADQGLHSTDFRATERLVQQIVQVSGRAGRATKPGRVLIQTHHPTHPVFAVLQARSYDPFADYALAERREVGYPPYTYLALLRAESPKAQAALAFLHAARALARRLAEGSAVQVMEPVPSPMERRAGRYRAQLLVQSTERRALHALLTPWVEQLSELKAGKRVRWSLDVDPIDLD